MPMLRFMVPMHEQNRNGAFHNRFAPYPKRGIAPRARHAMLAKSFTFDGRAPVKFV